MLRFMYHCHFDTYVVHCQVNEIRDMIEKIAVNVDDVKKKQSTILSAPHTDDSQSFFVFLYTFYKVI